MERARTVPASGGSPGPGHRPRIAAVLAAALAVLALLLALAFLVTGTLLTLGVLLVPVLLLAGLAAVLRYRRRARRSA